MLVAMIILPCMDAIAKYMAVYQGMSPAQVTFYRFFFQLVSMVPMLLSAGGLRALKPKRLWFNPSARRAPRRRRAAVFRLGQIHAACRCLRHLFCRTVHPHVPFGSDPARKSRLAALACHLHWFRRGNDRHPAEFRNLRPEVVDAGFLCLPVCLLPAAQPGGRQCRYTFDNADRCRYRRIAVHDRRHCNWL